MTENDGFARPLLATTRYRESGDCTTLSGRSPTMIWRPAGASRQPFGRSIDPSDIVPGDAGAGGCTSARSSAANAAPIPTAISEYVKVRMVRPALKRDPPDR